MRTKFDERLLKAMALAKWRIGPAESLVKVVPHARTGAAVVTGYVTKLKFVAGRTPEGMERTLGLRRSEWAEGASVFVVRATTGLGGVRITMAHAVSRRGAV